MAKVVVVMLCPEEEKVKKSGSTNIKQTLVNMKITLRPSEIECV